MFESYLKRWSLAPDGAPIATHSSNLLPVLCDRVPAMLKIAHSAEERHGADLMVWWNGNGAARVLKQGGDAILLERATGDRSLAAMAHQDLDDEASRVICDVAGRLHARRNPPPSDIVPLTAWIAELWQAAAIHGAILTQASATAMDTGLCGTIRRVDNRRER